jgi:hypothetical protein
MTDNEMDPRQKALELILAERREQEEKWGVQDHSMAHWMLILDEEKGELSQAIAETVMKGAHPERGGMDKIIEEAVHTAAVAEQFVESFFRGDGHKHEQRL